jgi:CheY-like chemotaxis protein
MAERKRILVVEDDRGWQEEIADILSGYEMTLSSSVREACAEIDAAAHAKRRFDLALLDLELSTTMGIDSGLAVLAYLKERHLDTPCIILTGHALPMSKAASLFQEYGVFAGLEKPRDIPRLAGTVRSALEQSDSRRSAAIKILFLAANPSNTARLQIDAESRSIDQALRQAEFRDRFEVAQHWAVRVTDLQALLLRHEPDILHFSGHGSDRSELIFEDDLGRIQPVSARALGQLFSVLKGNIRCVVLNACYSEDQARAIAQHIDCVIGMSKSISDPASVSFSAAFYQALGFGRDVKTAFDLGCIQIDLANLGEQDTPKLLSVIGNPENVVFAGKGAT